MKSMILILVSVLLSVFNDPLEPVAMHRISVMTFNLHDDMSNWSDRQEVMRQMIVLDPPVILGVQEAQLNQLEVLATVLPHHRIIQGPARGGRHFRNSILFDTRRFELQDSGYVDLPGELEHLRFYVWVLLEDKRQGITLLVVSTHFSSHDREPARLKQAETLVASLSHNQAGTILLGDFNARPDSAVMDVFVEAGYVDTWEVAWRHDSPLSNTSHGYSEPNFKSSRRIDWILVSEGIRVYDTEIDHFQIDDQYPSDHYPVRATVATRGQS